MKLAFVSGATSGIGMAVARLLAKKGLSLLLTGRDEEKLEALRQELAQMVLVEVFSADLSEEDGRKRVVAEIRKRTPDLVINNAGFGLYGAAVAMPVQKELEVVQVDVLSVLEITLEAARALKEKGEKGTILNVSSAAAFQVFPFFATYAASKSFVNSVSQALDFELKEAGIRVLVSCPGQVSTNFSKRASGKSVYVNKGFLVMDVEDAAEAIYYQIEKGIPLHVFNWKYRVLNFLSRFIPTSISAGLVKKVVSKRT